MKTLADWKKHLHKQTGLFLSKDLGIDTTSFAMNSKIEEFAKNEELRTSILNFLRGTFNVLLDVTNIEDEPTWKFLLTFEDIYLLALEEMNILPRKGETIKLRKTLSSSKRNSPFVHRETSPEISTILPSHLYLSSSLGASDLKSLKELNIRYIVNCALELPNHHPNEFTYINLNLKDNHEEIIIDTFEDAFALIEKAKAEECGVLVHCYAGISRSSTVIIGYLMKHLSLKLSAAYALTQCRRPIIQPNASYGRQLLKYEDVIFGSALTSVS